jgi:hypothetical protein
LINHYKIDLGTDGVIVNCQSEEEILADKLVAFVGRDKIKPRFLPLQVYQRTILKDGFWESLVNTQTMLLARGKALIQNTGRADQWEF